MNNKKISSFRKRMNRSSQLTAEAIRKELLESRFIIQSHNKVKLEKSLSLTNDSYLVDKTLLTPSIHKVHSKSLFERYIKHSNTDKHKKYKFLTLLDSVEILDEKRILNSIEQMKYELHKVISESKAIWCLGSIEVEIVSIKTMKEIRERDKLDESEHRKLHVLEILSKRLRKKKERESHSLALIHFHGIVTSSNDFYLDKFNFNLKQIKKWNRAQRQIELKNLSKNFNGSHKSLKENLKHISTYITKGGNDWYANKSYLRYKIGFDNETFDSEDSWIKKNWRRNKILKQEQKEEGIEDVLSMNRLEISLLANVIYKLMCLRKDKKGYLIFGKSGKFSHNIYQNYIKKLEQDKNIITTLY